MKCAGWDFKNYDFVCDSQAHAKQLGALVRREMLMVKLVCEVTKGRRCVFSKGQPYLSLRTTLYVHETRVEIALKYLKTGITKMVSD